MVVKDGGLDEAAKRDVSSGGLAKVDVVVIALLFGKVGGDDDRDAITVGLEVEPPKLGIEPLKLGALVHIFKWFLRQLVL